MATISPVPEKSRSQELVKQTTSKDNNYGRSCRPCKNITIKNSKLTWYFVYLCIYYATMVIIDYISQNILTLQCLQLTKRSINAASCILQHLYLQLLIDEEFILKWLHHTLSPGLRGTRCWSLFIGRRQKKDLKPPIHSSGLICKCESYLRLLHAGNNCSETQRSQDKYTVGVVQPFTQLPMADNYYPPTHEVRDHNDLSQGKSLWLCMHCTIKTGIIYAVANCSISSALLNSNSLFFPLKLSPLFLSNIGSLFSPNSQ